MRMSILCALIAGTFAVNAFATETAAPTKAPEVKAAAAHQVLAQNTTAASTQSEAGLKPSKEEKAEAAEGTQPAATSHKSSHKSSHKHHEKKHSTSSKTTQG